MRSNTLKLSLVLALSLVALAACDKHGKKSEEAAAPDTTNVAAATTPPATTPMVAPAPTPAAVGGDVKEKFKAMKLACADDIKKFCTGADKPIRCLKEHESELSPGCNAARATFRAARKAEKADKAE